MVVVWDLWEMGGICERLVGFVGDVWYLWEMGGICGRRCTV